MNPEEVRLPGIPSEVLTRFCQTLEAAIAKHPDLHLDWEVGLCARVHGPDPAGLLLTLWPQPGGEVGARVHRVVEDDLVWDHYQVAEIPDIMYTCRYERGLVD